MVVKRALTDEKNILINKRARIGKTATGPSIVINHGQGKSSKHAFLDDTTGFGDDLSLRQFINPQAAKLYNDVHVSVFVFHYLL